MAIFCIIMIPDIGIAIKPEHLIREEITKKITGICIILTYNEIRYIFIFIYFFNFYCLYDILTRQSTRDDLNERII